MSRFRRQRSNERGRDAVEVDDTATFAAEVETAQAVVRRYTRWTDIRFGAGTRCPACGAMGFVVSVNRVAGSSDNACLQCPTDWRLTVRALDAVAEQELEATRLRRASLPDVPEPLAVLAAPDRSTAPEPAPPAPVVPPAPIFVAATADLGIEATPAVLEAFLQAPATEDERGAESGVSYF